MKKKILIGSIIAVVLLTLVSFSSVVGYSSVKSDSKIASPLFGIMTNRATNKEKYVVTSEYICKGKAINILLPKRNDKAELVEKFVNRIKMMDDDAFDKFVNIIINNLRQRADFQNFNNEDIVKFLNQIRNYQDSYIRNQDDSKPFGTWFYCTVIRNGAFCWYLGVIFIPLMIFIVEVMRERLATCGFFGDCWTNPGTLVCRN